MREPATTSIKSVLVLGSGPIVIGQAAEFDYAGTKRVALSARRASVRSSSIPTQRRS